MLEEKVAEEHSTVLMSLDDKKNAVCLVSLSLPVTSLSRETQTLKILSLCSGYFHAVLERKEQSSLLPQTSNSKERE